MRGVQRRFMNNCLVIVDVQRGFMIDTDTKEIPKKIEYLLRKMRFDHIVCTQYYNEDGSPFDTLMGWNELKDLESQEVDKYVMEVSERVFRKNIYTCFNQEFEEYIRLNNIDKLYFVGIDTECCVLKSCADCFEKNIQLEVLVNYCASTGGKSSHYAGITVMKRLLGSNAINFDL